MVELPYSTTHENAAGRGCDVCGSKAVTRVHSQRFATFDDFSGLSGYDVVTCNRCGFAYADHLPNQTTLDRYYRELSKYEQHETGGDIAPWAAIRNRAIVQEIAARLPDRNARILDVGCATGHLLAAFREAGFANVTGLDPSRRCVEIARDLYGIRVLNIPISEMRFDREQFDLILVSAVLEHLRDLQGSVKALTSMLADGGAIWFEVPDAGRFSKFAYSPFQQFSLEHINYFTPESLSNLLRRCGYGPVDIWRPVRSVRSFDEPGLDGLFTRGLRDSAVDPMDGADIAVYVSASSALQERLLASISPLAEAGSPVILWGTGSLTLHLMTDPRFSRLNISAFVDSNTNYQGKTIRGIPVIPPDAVRESSAPILVISHASTAEIIKDIRDRHRLGNRTIDIAELAGT